MEVVAYQLLCKHANSLEESRFAVPPELILVQPDQPVNKVKRASFFFSFLIVVFGPRGY